MAFTLSWAIENTVVLGLLDSDLSVDQAGAVFTGIYDLIEQSSAPLVYVVVDARGLKMTGKAPSLSELIPFVRGWKIHKRAGWTVAVRHANPLLNFLSDVMMQVVGLRVRTVKTSAEALAFLQSIDVHVDWSSFDPAFIARDDKFLIAQNTPS